MGEIKSGSCDDLLSFSPMLSADNDPVCCLRIDIDFTAFFYRGRISNKYSAFVTIKITRGLLTAKFTIGKVIFLDVRTREQISTDSFMKFYHF